jgi:hypothetical protein
MNYYIADFPSLDMLRYFMTANRELGGGVVRMPNGEYCVKTPMSFESLCDMGAFVISKATRERYDKEFSDLTQRILKKLGP